MSAWLKTRRLELREFGAEHADELYALDSDPRVMKYIGDGRLSTREQVDDAIRRVPRAYALYPGLGTWRATRRDNGEFVGWFALKYVPRTAEVEVGYRLRFAAWGRGYATEGATRARPLRLRGARPVPDHRRHASRQRRIAARAAEGGACRRRLGPLLRPQAAAVRVPATPDRRTHMKR